MATTNCGECLFNTCDVVALVGGVCPKCGADYRDTLVDHLWPEPQPEKETHE